MSFRLVRVLVARALGRDLAMPLRGWVEGLYSQIDLINSEDYFLRWLRMLSKLPAVYRRTGVPYKVAEHWASAVRDTPMDFFDSAASELKEWNSIFIKVNTKNMKSYSEFWKWTGPNPYQVKIWLAEVVRKFFNALWAEHGKMLEEQRNPEAREEKEDKPQLPESIEEDSEEAKTWKETEQLLEKLRGREDEKFKSEWGK